MGLPPPFLHWNGSCKSNQDHQIAKSIDNWGFYKRPFCSLWHCEAFLSSSSSFLTFEITFFHGFLLFSRWSVFIDFPQLLHISVFLKFSFLCPKILVYWSFTFFFSINLFSLNYFTTNYVSVTTMCGTLVSAFLLSAGSFFINLLDIFL